MPPAPATSEMLAEMSACAYRLGLSFAEAAERTQDLDRKLEMFQLFDRCFFAVRVATALQLRLRREAGAQVHDTAREPAGEAEDLREREASDAELRERERERLEAERDRETERASLPVFLQTLKGVAADAAALPGPKAAELPTLQDLLVRVGAEPSAAKPQGRSALLRDRLAGSTATGVATVLTALRPSPVLPARRATGPPRR